MTQERITYIDLAKCITIFLVLWGHTIDWNYYGDPCMDDWTFQTIYAFHMPLFMTMSGFFLQKTLNSGIKDVIINKSRQLLLPVFSFCLIFLLFRNTIYIRLTGATWQDIPSYISGGAMWFLKYLFVCTLVAYFSKRIFRNDLWAAILPTLLLFTLTRSSIFRLLPFLWVGYFLSKHASFHQRRLIPIFIGSIAGFVALRCVWHGEYDFPIRFVYLKSPVHIDWEAALHVLIRFLIGLTGSIMTLSFCQLWDRMWKKCHLKEFLCRIGTNTLGIYCLQIYFLEFLLSHVPLPEALGNCIPFKFLIAIVMLILLHGATELLKRNKWTAFFFLGRKLPSTISQQK